MNWNDLQAFRSCFLANCEALATRDADLADRLRAHVPSSTFAFAIDGELVHLAKVEGTTANVVPVRLGLPAAKQVIQKLCPSGKYTEAVLLAGLDQGWLWELAYNLPVEAPLNPGHRPPLYLASQSLEQLWIVCHLHDWRKLLTDRRAILVAGPDAYQRLMGMFNAHPGLPVPRLSITINPAVWPQGKSLDVLSREIGESLTARLQCSNQSLANLYPPAGPPALRARLQGAAKLRVLGISSLYTTFLQHSMRDWLAAFEAAGHDTRLIIETGDHEQLNSLVLSESVAAFKPDLILLIDHYRAELGGLPPNCPAVMWIQDYLPNLFNANAGAAQTNWDYTIGYNRSECTSKFGYPYERFMPAMVVVNEQRFSPPQLSGDDRRTYECDICFVSHASKPAEQIVQEQIERNPHARGLLSEALDRLRAIYDAGHFLSHPVHVKGLIEEACIARRMTPDTASMQSLVDLFTHRVNNALFRHQMIGWAADLDVNLHLYGHGWEKHPRFAKYARGPADNTTDLVKIYRAATINLQVTPHGAVHQRLLEGLASGGFFLIRYVPGDVIERMYSPLWDWCCREGIQTDEQLMQRATPEVFKLLGQLQRTLGIDPFKLHISLMDDLRTGADTRFVRSAGMLFADYESVAFDSASMFQQKIRHFLSHPDQRAQITQSMRKTVLERMTYRAVNERLLNFISSDISSRFTPSEAAA